MALAFGTEQGDARKPLLDTRSVYKRSPNMASKNAKPKRRQGILPALGMNNPPPQNRSGGNFNNIKLIWVLKCLATTNPQNPLSKAWNFWHVL